MHFVYVCRDGDNEELRYSIRSVLSSFPQADIWVVGGKPSWYTGNYIEVKQSYSKYRNVLNNLSAICSSDLIEDSFIFMNDDFFIINKIETISVLHGGTLENKIKEYVRLDASSRYTGMLNTTYDRLLKLKISNPIDYELHVPMTIEKSKLKVIVDKHYNFLWRSMYGNIFNIGGEEIKDVKVYKNKKLIARSHDLDVKSNFLSTHDESFALIIDKLSILFPDKSSCEL